MTKSEKEIVDKINALEKDFITNPVSRDKDRANQLAKSLIAVNATTCEYAHQKIERYILEFPTAISNTLKESKSSNKENTGFLGYLKKKLFSSERRQANMPPNQEEKKARIEPLTDKLQSYVNLSKELQNLGDRLKQKCDIAKGHESNEDNPWINFMIKDLILPDAEEINQISQKADKIYAEVVHH